MTLHRLLALAVALSLAAGPLQARNGADPRLPSVSHEWTYVVPWAQDVPNLTLATGAGNGSTAGKDWMGGATTWAIWGTWDSATAQLQYSPDDGTTWVDVEGASRTDNGAWLNIPLPGTAAKYRVTISGGGAPSLTSILSHN
jgi:hypothetical protein